MTWPLYLVATAVRASLELMWRLHWSPARTVRLVAVNTWALWRIERAWRQAEGAR